MIGALVAQIFMFEIVDEDDDDAGRQTDAVAWVYYKYRLLNVYRNRTFNNRFIIYHLNSYFTIDNASIYRIQDHHFAFHFAIVNAKQLFLGP